MAETPIDLTAAPAISLPERGAFRDRTPAEAIMAYCRRNPQVVVGLVMVLALILIGIIGPLFVNMKNAEPLSALPAQSPSRQYLLGTDDQGRELLAVMIAGLPATMRIGFLAGGIGLAIGIVLGFLSGYLGGVVDAIIRTAVDTLLTVPGLLILITVAASIKTFISVNIMALVIASLAWRYPTRIIRAQVLTMRERTYVQVARRSGMNATEIIVRELLPNLFPFLAASFVSAVFGAILFSIGLEALGLGPQNQPTLGMTIYWAIRFNALLRGMWWWWIPPIVILATLFFGLLLLTIGLDEIANPRLRRTA
jgi:peptide/nickel transport system permease protein